MSPVSPVLRLLLVLITSFLFLSILELVRRGRLRERYSLLLLMVGGILLFLSIFGQALATAAASLRVRFPPSLLVSVAFIVTFAIQIAQAAIISALSLNTRDLAQKMAQQEWQIRQLCECARILAEHQRKQEAIEPATCHEELALSSVEGTVAPIGERESE